MDFALLSFLAGATARSLVLSVLPLGLLAALRVKSAAARHAVLFLTTAGMLALAALNPLLPPIPLRVLHAPAAAAMTLPTPAVPVAAIATAADSATPAPSPAPAPLAPRLLAAVYCAGLMFCLARLLLGALFTRRLLRGARAIESHLGPQVYESSWISVPLTVGWLRPRILLPAGWREWEPAKLEAVLVHERNHIRRGDWAIALSAAVNRSVYWFNPLAWWLERRLATLAELACDDAALLALGERESYAQALLDMAAAVHTGHGRLVWDALAMAKRKEVRTRIERILDDGRQIPQSLTRRRWLVLLACGLPLVYVAAALQPVPAAAQDQPQTPPAIAELLQHRPNLTAADAAQLERHLAANPDDLEARQRLIVYYFSTPQRETRLAHIYWLIANHPESSEAAVASQGITPAATTFNSFADYERAGALWRQQVASHPNDDAVLLNAGVFFAQPGGDPNEAERLFLAARALHPGMAPATHRLAELYATAILGTSGDPGFPDHNPEFGNRVRSQIESGTDWMLLSMTGSRLVSVANVPPADGRPLPPGALNLNDHPLLVPVRDLGSRLLATAGKLMPRPGLLSRVPTAETPDRQAAGRSAPQPSTQAILTGPDAPHSTSAQAEPAPGFTPALRHITTVQDAFPGLPVLSPRPTPVSSVDPQYPVLARQARIQGIVGLAVAIGTDGHVTQVRVLHGHPLLLSAAMDAVRQYVYPPVSEAGAFEENVNFTLPPGTVDPLTAGALPNVVLRRGNTRTFFFNNPPGSQVITVGPVVQAAMLVKKVDPVYPPLAQSARVQGNVVLDILVARDGTVASVIVEQGHPLLLQAAMDAVKQWVYKPTLLNGQPVEVSTSVTIPFELPQ